MTVFQQEALIQIQAEEDLRMMRALNQLVLDEAVWHILQGVPETENINTVYAQVLKRGISIR